MANKIYNKWQYHSNQSLAYVVEGNKIITDVVRLMLGGGTFLFAISGTLIGTHSFDLPLWLRGHLVFSWLLIFFSFVAGIRQLISDSSYLGKWSALHTQAMETLEQNEIDEAIAFKEVDRVFNGQPIVSDMSNFRAQLWLMGTAFLIQIFVIAWALFI